MIGSILLFFSWLSQSTVCIATRFGKCTLTFLDKLWYLYTYIYDRFKSIATFKTLLLSFAVVTTLMPTTKNTTTPTITSIVSPSPYLSRSRLFTMTNVLLSLIIPSNSISIHAVNDLPTHSTTRT